MQKNADVVIIGGGVHGCSIAYHLAKAGVKNIAVLEKKYLASGGSGRSAAGIRQQFGTDINIYLSAETVKMIENLTDELDYPHDMELMQEGYTMLAYSESQLKQFEENSNRQNTLIPGCETEILSPGELKRRFPLLNTANLHGASFNRQDGHICPFHLTNSHAVAAKRLGVNFYTYQEVVNIFSEGSKVTGVETKDGHIINTPIVVNAAGPHGGQISRMVGLEIPMYPERHQILVTEPLDMVVPSMMISLTHGVYFKQTGNGSMLMGVNDPNEVKDFNENSTGGFLVEVAKKAMAHMPALRNTRVVRQWAGLYDITPDQQPILGPVDEIEGFYMNVGWSGHGLMMGPVIGKLMSQMITGKELDIDISCLHFNRFKTGELIPEPVCI